MKLPVDPMYRQASSEHQYQSVFIFQVQTFCGYDRY